MQLQKSSMGVGIVAAIASSLCCITPLIAILAGSSSLAANFQWVEPLRPWLIGATVAALGLAWYLKLRPVSQDDCCDVANPKFWNGKPFLGAITVMSALMLTFPLYANVFYPNHQSETIASSSTAQEVEFVVIGMTCTGCEGHVEHAVAELHGIGKVEASYKESNAIVVFDPEQTSIDDITKAIESTSYEVTDVKSNDPDKID